MHCGPRAKAGNRLPACLISADESPHLSLLFLAPRIIPQDQRPGGGTSPPRQLAFKSSDSHVMFHSSVQKFPEMP